MKFVARVHQAVEQLAVRTGQLGIHVEIPDLLAVGQLGQICVDPIDHGHHRHIIVAREDAGHDDGGVGSLGLHDAQDGLESPGDIRDFGFIAARRNGTADVIGAGEQHDDLRVDSVQFPIVETPEDVLSLIGAPAEIGRVPTEKVLFPIRQQRGIVGRAPTPRDRVAFEIDVDAALLRFLEQLRMGKHGVRVGAGDGLIGGERRGLRNGRRGSNGGRLVADELVCPRDEVFPIGAVSMAAVMLAPGELPVQQAGIDRRHFRRVIVVRHAQVLGAQEPEHRSGGHCRHETALLIEPFRVALLRHAVTDEGQPRCAQCDQFMRVHRQIAGVLAAKSRI